MGYDMEKIRNVKFKYTYIDMGSVAGSNDFLEVRKDRIFLDVGNGLYTGVIDHHHRLNGIVIQNSIYRSATKLVTAYPEYILNNISDHAEEVEIILHKSPDFDCYASAFLVEHLIQYGGFPEGYDAFADYVDMVDAGLIRIKKDNYREVYGIAYSIYNVLAQDLKENQKEVDQNQFSILLRNRWYELFDFVLDWINQHKNYNLYGADIFGQGSPFEKEIAYVEKDYEIYKRELEDSTMCQRIWLKLPKINDDSNGLYEVEGLLYNKVPKSTLTKAWARVDSENSSGDGFVFTFIPVSMDRELSSLANGECIRTNRVIISVEPNSGYSLNGLAKQLEIAEKEKEDMVFADHKHLMRCRDKRRPGFNQSWCSNDDPWYDGQNFNYTIVDSPRRGSILSLDEIKKIVLNYTIAKLQEFYCNIVLPFTIDDKNATEFFENPKNHIKYVIQLHENGVTDYFLNYIQRYLRYTQDDDENIGCNKFRITTEPLCFVIKEDEQLEIVAASRMERASEQSALAVSTIDLITYKYGIGFISINTHMPSSKKKTSFKEALRMNYVIRQSYQYISNYFIKEKCLINTEFYKPLLYSSVILDPEGFYEYEKKEMLYKLCNCFDWDEPYANNTFVESSLQQLFMEMNSNCCYGFSKSGGAVICTPDHKVLSDKYIRNQVNTFKTIYYEIFLFSLHQRLSLLRLENLLSKYDGRNKTGHLGKLRRQMMNFVTQGWFSQITEDEVGQEIYRRWQSVFECEKLYEEVLQQIESVDEYKNSRKSQLYENLSIIVFPLLLILEIIGSGLFKIKAIGPEEGFDWWITSGFIVVFSIITFLLFKLRKR